MEREAVGHFVEFTQNLRQATFPEGRAELICDGGDRNSERAVEEEGSHYCHTKKNAKYNPSGQKLCILLEGIWLKAQLVAAIFLD